MTFDEIYNAYYQATVRQAQRQLCMVTGDPHESLQLASDIFIELDQELQAGKVITHPVGYLKNKLTYRVLDWLRRHFSPHQLPMNKENPEYVTGTTIPFDNQLALREQLDNVLNQLKPVERQAIQLCYVDGHTHREAAAVQQVPVSTFEKRLLSATRKARHHFQKGTTPCCKPCLYTTLPSPLMMGMN